MKLTKEEKAKLLSVQEVHKMFGIGLSKLYVDTTNGKLPSFKVGGSIVIDRNDLIQYLLPPKILNGLKQTFTEEDFFKELKKYWG